MAVSVGDAGAARLAALIAFSACTVAVVRAGATHKMFDAGLQTRKMPQTPVVASPEGKLL